jgi:AcrR family transcriptional regulator
MSAGPSSTGRRPGVPVKAPTGRRQGDPLSRREATKQANRAAILDAGREVFADLGYGAATVRDIVRATDLATGTFYNYFPDKEAVFRALLEESVSEARALARAARQAAASLEEFVSDAYRAYFAFLASDPKLFMLVRRNAGTVSTQFAEPAFGLSRAELEEDLRAGVRAGVIPAHDVGYMAAAMVGTAFEVGVSMVERDPPDVDGATRFATGVFLGAFGLLKNGDPLAER